MTDNLTTELLCKLLEERGLSYQTHYLHVSWRVGPKLFDAVDNLDGTLTVDNLTPEQAIVATLGSEVNGETSDGYHTFDELYHHRAVLFSVIVCDHRELAWKAKKHHDGTMYDGMFIVGIETPKGQATYHYDIDPYWAMFDCEEREFAPEWDGHTPDDAISRIAELGSEPPYDELLRCLENDWNIRASWDGLRRFWCIELTEEGVRLRDAEGGRR